MLAPRSAEKIVNTAVTALKRGNGWRAALDELDVPVYTTDKHGFVTYWNRACVDFAGREPELGSDRWCVTWKLYTTSGDPLPHDACPMAVAIKSGEVVRGKVAIAMRPDGKRRAFTPYPTPVLDECGEVIGAVNLLVDVSAEQADALSEQATRCRRLSQSTTDPRASRILADMANEYAGTSEALRAAAPSLTTISA